MTIPFSGPDVPMAVRTDDKYFKDLPGYPFKPNYIDVSNPYADGTTSSSLRMHYVDEGPKDGPVVLMAHGEPAWSYLYRKMIPVFAAAGFRAIAPDHIGFGRSDKLCRAPHYSFENHIQWLRELVVGLDLKNITLVCQDWGGPIGLGVLARESQRFASVVAGNTMLHTAEPELHGRIDWAAHASSETDSTVSTMLLDWMHYTHRAVDFDASGSVHGATARGMSDKEIAAYDAPFPSEWHKAGMRHFPVLIPVTVSDIGAEINRQTWATLKQFERPFLTLFGDSDPPTRGWEKIFQERVPGAKNQPHQSLTQAGHFWQEDCGAEAAEIIIQWMKK